MSLLENTAAVLSCLIALAILFYGAAFCFFYLTFWRVR